MQGFWVNKGNWEFIWKKQLAWADFQEKHRSQTAINADHLENV